MVILGIMFGLGAAFCQSLSYLYSRRFIKECGEDWRLLLAVSQVLMGIMSMIILPFIVHGGDFTAMKAAVMPSIGAAAFYFVAQGALFAALKRTEASRVSPLLGLKVVVVACIASFLGRQNLDWQNWVAVVLSGSAAFFLNEIGGRIPGKAVIFICLTVVGYSISDMNIKELLVCLEPVGARGPFIGVCMAYIVSGMFGGVMFVRTGFPGRRAWLFAMPHALAWFASMFFFYWSIVFINLVFAVIVQSTRGLMSIWMGVVVAKLGHEHIEKPLDPNVVWKRAAAAVLMAMAIALYSLPR